jgi:flagellar motor switch protein FliM
MTATATPFDFSTPRRISPVGQLALREWQEMLCASVTESSRSLSDGPVNWKVESIETLKSKSVLNTLTDQHLIYHIAIDDESVNSLWHWDQAAALGVVASLLGSLDVPEPRALTTIEQALLEMALDCWTRGFTATWPIAGSIDAVFSRVTNTRFARKLLDRVEDVVAVQYSLTTGVGSFAANWIVPKAFLEEHLADISDPDADSDEQANASVEMLGSEIPVSISVELGRKTVPLSRIRALQEHDVIILDQSIHEPLRVLVEGSVKMAGLPGRTDNRQLIKIVSMAEH